MIRLHFGEIRMTQLAREPVLLLVEEAGERTLPVWITAASAHAVLTATDDPGTAPSTHDLIIDILAAVGAQAEEARILHVDEGVYSAEIVVNGQAVAARISDVVALALRAGVPILASEEVMNVAGITEPDAAAEPVGLNADDQVQQFRAFLDTITPEDFEVPGDEA